MPPDGEADSGEGGGIVDLPDQAGLGCPSEVRDAGGRRNQQTHGCWTVIGNKLSIFVGCIYRITTPRFFPKAQ